MMAYTPGYLLAVPSERKRLGFLILALMGLGAEG